MAGVLVYRWESFSAQRAQLTVPVLPQHVGIETSGITEQAKKAAVAL